MEINQEDKTIAVLPFVNMSASEENEYFSDGITEEIINALAKIGNLKVTSRTSSFFFKGKKLPIAKSREYENLTIEGLAYESGFNSKTVFNTYFKRATGLTPKQYLNQQV